MAEYVKDPILEDDLLLAKAAELYSFGDGILSKVLGLMREEDIFETALEAPFERVPAMREGMERYVRITERLEKYSAEFKRREELRKGNQDKPVK